MLSSPRRRKYCATWSKAFSRLLQKSARMRRPYYYDHCDIGSIEYGGVP
jgi:hypothetical protein